MSEMLALARGERIKAVVWLTTDKRPQMAIIARKERQQARQIALVVRVLKSVSGKPVQVV